MMILLILIFVSLAHALSCNQTDTNHFVCHGGGVDNDDFTDILLSLPLDTLSLYISGKSDRRNYFAMSQDLRRFEELRDLKLTHGTVQRFGEDIFSVHNSLQYLDVSHNMISHVNQRTFADTVYLLSLDLSHNKLGKMGLPSTVFSKLRSLHTLNLADNNLHVISHSIFQGLSNLSSLNLAGNAISRYLDARILSHSPTLRRLNLDRCAIETIPEDFFRFSAHLEELSLAGNRLRAIPHTALLVTATHLQSLDLADNLLREVPGRIFYDWSLRHVNFTRNKLKDGIEPEAFARSALVGVRLGGNGLKYDDLEALLPIAQNVLELDVSWNPIFHFDPKFFAKFPNLEYLDISGLELQQIPNTFLPFHRRLLHYNISNNELRNMSYGTLIAMSSLRTFDLSNNLLKNFETLTFSNHLQNVFLSRNPWNCGCRTFAFQETLRTLQDRVQNSSDISEVKCSQPPSVAGQLIIGLKSDVIPTCSAIFGAMGLTDHSELSILITASGAVLLILVLVVAVTCSYFMPKIRNRSNQGSKLNMSTGSSDNSDIGNVVRGTSHDEIVLQGVSPLNEEKLPAEHKAFILEVDL